MVATIASSILLLSTVSTQPVFAFEPNQASESSKSFKKQHKRRMAKMARALGLTEEQKTAIKDIREQAKSEKSVLKEQLAGFKDAVKALMANDEFDEEAFLALKSQHQDTFTQLALLKAKTRHSIGQVLTDEQKAKAEEFKARRKSGLFH